MSQNDDDLAQEISILIEAMNTESSNSVLKDMCPSYPNLDECNWWEKDERIPERVIADAVVTYFRSEDYAQDAANNIADLLAEEVRCANDPECGNGPIDGP